LFRDADLYVVLTDLPPTESMRRVRPNVIECNTHAAFDSLPDEGASRTRYERSVHRYIG